MDRRSFLRAGAVTAIATGTTAFGPAFWRAALAEPTVPGEGPYGPLGQPDANGVRLPRGFHSRVVAVSGEPVVPDGYRWHVQPDGAACYPTPDDGWLYVSNCEFAPNSSVPEGGGVGVIVFGPDGEKTGAYRILEGTRINCSGGATPWGTWLSCEEVVDGLVYECDPYGVEPAVALPALGSFKHEAAVVDPVSKAVYLTEDSSTQSRFYRFVPAVWPDGGRPDLTVGQLQVAQVDYQGGVTSPAVPPADGPRPVTWIDISLAEAAGGHRQDTSTRFRRGEGAWSDSGVVYWCESGPSNVWAYDGAAGTLEAVHVGATPGSPLKGADNITVSRFGDLFVAEDGGDLQLVLVSAPDAAGQREIAPFLQLSGQLGINTEISGPAFNPAGNRLYFSSQRGLTGERADGGITYEVRGPFATQRRRQGRQGA